MAVPARPDELPLRSSFDWLRTSVDVPPDGRVLVAAATVALATDVAVRSGGVGLGGALLVVLVAGTVLASGRVTNVQARLVLASVPLFGVWLVLRTSPWLLVPDLVVVGCLLVLGVSLGERSLFDLSVPAAAARGIQVLWHGVAGPSYVVGAARTLSPPPDQSRRARVRAVLRGVMLAAPLLVILGLLLASADAVFASVFTVDVNPPSIMIHVTAIALGAWTIGGLLRAASAAPVTHLPSAPRLGWVEAAVVLGLINAMFLTFAIAQLVALSEGGRRVIESAGLTYAQYARRGFFQLLAVAAITLAVVLALRAMVDQTDRAARRRLALLAQVTVALTLVIVFVAVRRLGLYADVFGLTMLRLYSTVFAYWIGVVFVLLGAALLGIGRGRAWLLSAAVGVGLAALLWLNVVNPEAVVVRHNVGFATATGRFDPAYVSGLSADAVPALVAALPELGPDAEQVLARLCPPRRPRQTGWAAYNVARDRAFGSLAAACSATG